MWENYTAFDQKVINKRTKDMETFATQQVGKTIVLNDIINCITQQEQYSDKREL